MCNISINGFKVRVFYISWARRPFDHGPEILFRVVERRGS